MSVKLMGTTRTGCNINGQDNQNTSIKASTGMQSKKIWRSDIFGEHKEYTLNLILQSSCSWLNVIFYGQLE
jgi:hypothetical protein